MNIEVALGCMRLLANLGRNGYLDGVGVSKAEFDRLVGDDPWTGSERSRMTNVLHTLVNSSIDAMGLPRFNLPAEYIAAGIAMFVSGVNVMPACVFAPVSGTADEMGRAQSVTKCTPDQLFALVVQLYADPASSSATALFAQKTSLNIERSLVKEEETI